MFKDNNKYVAPVVTAGIILGFSLLIIPKTPLGSEKIGNIFEKEEYTTYYYATMFPDGSTSKNYKVIAEIYAKDKQYVVKKVYFPNDGYITFFDQADNLSFTEPTHIEEIDGKYWDIQLINEKPLIQEIDRLNKGN